MTRPSSDARAELEAARDACSPIEQALAVSGEPLEPGYPPHPAVERVLRLRRAIRWVRALGPQHEA